MSQVSIQFINSTLLQGQQFTIETTQGESLDDIRNRVFDVYWKNVGTLTTMKRHGDASLVEIKCDNLSVESIQRLNELVRKNKIFDITFKQPEHRVAM